jgi:signal transduction histidine kinase
MASRKSAQLAFASALAVLLLSAVAAYVTIVRLRDSARWVVHTYQVESKLGELEASVAVLTRARTAFAMSGNEEVLGSLGRGIPEARRKLREIRALIVDNPRQVDLCARLEEATERRLALVQESIALRKSSPKDDAGQANLMGKGLAVGFQSAAIMQQMRQEEQTLLQIRTTQSNRLFVLTVLILFLTFALALILFFIHYRLLNSELRARELAEAAARQGEESLRHLTSRLLHMQDEERRKFSRELHDSLGQYLAGAKMSLDMFLRSHPQEEMLVNASQMLKQSIAETRTISHLLHPPLLDEVGFASAARWYVQGFSERSGIEVRMDIPDDLTRLARPLELVLFRVLQESLTNIHRHSRSLKAEVKLESTAHRVVLQVKDYGKGIPQESLRAFKSQGTNLGVGLTGMRERVREFSGQLQIQSSPQGTMIRVTLPLAFEAGEAASPVG